MSCAWCLGTGWSLVRDDECPRCTREDLDAPAQPSIPRDLAERLETVLRRELLGRVDAEHVAASLVRALDCALGRGRADLCQMIRGVAGVDQPAAERLLDVVLEVLRADVRAARWRPRDEERLGPLVEMGTAALAGVVQRMEGP